MDWSVTDCLVTAVCASLLLSAGLLLLLAALCLYVKLRAAAVAAKQPRSEVSVGFFHPYCNAGGGGERGLWEAVTVTQTR